MPKSDYKAVSPEAFAPFLRTGQPKLVVGGQAVNIWATIYIEATAHLAPFLSQDLDLLGDTSTVEDIASSSALKPVWPKERIGSPVIGSFAAKQPDGELASIEVLHSVNGVASAELRETASPVEIAGAEVLVPSPVVLLKAKLANVADIDQSRRNDERHVQLLCALMPRHLRAVQEAFASEEDGERKLVNLLEKLLRIVISVPAPEILKRLRVDARNLFAGLNETPKIRAFLDKRLPRALPEAE